MTPGMGRRVAGAEGEARGVDGWGPDVKGWRSGWGWGGADGDGSVWGAGWESRGMGGVVGWAEGTVGAGEGTVGAGEGVSAGGGLGEGVSAGGGVGVGLSRVGVGGTGTGLTVEDGATLVGRLVGMV